MAKAPAYQFYTGDWMKDANLRGCSLAARGLWIDILCLMFDAEQKGVLRSNSVPWTAQKVVKSVAGARARNLAELIKNGVARVARKDGAMYSKRMIRDELKRRHKAQAGGKGGKQTGSKPRANPGSSSSSSSSPSGKDTPPTPSFDVLGPGQPFPPSRATEHMRTVFGEARQADGNIPPIPNFDKWVEGMIKAAGGGPAGVGYVLGFTVKDVLDAFTAYMGRTNKSQTWSGTWIQNARTGRTASAAEDESAKRRKENLEAKRRGQQTQREKFNDDFKAWKLTLPPGQLQKYIGDYKRTLKTVEQVFREHREQQKGK